MTYEILADIDLKQYFTLGSNWLFETVKSLHRDPFLDKQRIIFRYSGTKSSCDEVEAELDKFLNLVDIPAYFVIKEITETSYSGQNSDHSAVCVYPWIHVYAGTLGELQPCCVAHGEFGNIETYPTLEQAINNDAFKALRKNMLRGHWSQACIACKKSEDSTGASFRTTANKLFAHHLPLANETKRDGTITDFKLHYYDIRLNNICNFKCRTCSAVYSSSIAAEEGDVVPAVRKRNRAAFDSMMNSVMQHLDDVEIFYFAGGEPMLMQEHYDILDVLIAKNKTHVKLNYNTNASTLTFKGRSVIELWKQFEDVNLGLSLDGSGANAAYIRNGSNWEQLLSNITEIKQNAPHVKLRVATTISTYNALSVVSFHNELLESLFRPEDIDVQAAFGDLNDIRILPLAVKAKVQLAMSQSKLSKLYKPIVQFMNSEDRSSLYPEFLKNIKRVDTIRNENYDSLSH